MRKQTRIHRSKQRRSLSQGKKIRLFWKNELTGTVSTPSRVVGGTGKGETSEKHWETVKRIPKKKKLRKGKTKKIQEWETKTETYQSVNQLKKTVKWQLKRSVNFESRQENKSTNKAKRMSRP